MKRTFPINGRKVTIYSRKSKKKPLTKQKKAEYDIYFSIFSIIILAGGLIFLISTLLFAFHDIDLAYNFKDSPLDHYNLFNNESRSSDELYSSGWSKLFGIIYLYNIFCLCLMGLLIVSLLMDYDRYKKKFKRTIR